MVATPRKIAARTLDREAMALWAGLAPKRVVAHSEADSAALVERLLGQWQLLPSLSAKLLDGSLSKMLTPADLQRVRNTRIAVACFARAQIVGTADFLRQLDRHGVGYALLKGAAAACLFYPERHHRAAWDFDLGVAWDDVARAEALALSCGFNQAQRDPERGRFVRADRELRAIVEESHFELGFLARRLEVTNLSAEERQAIREEAWAHQFWHDADSAAPWCYSVVDIHHKLSLDIELTELLAGARRLEVAGANVSVPDLPWFAAHLIFKLYWEGVHQYGKGLYQYADLIRLVPLLDKAIFAQLLEILETHYLVAGAYHVLRRVPDFGVKLPRHIATFVTQAHTPPDGADPIDTNDLGDVWAKLWGRR